MSSQNQKPLKDAQRQAYASLKLEGLFLTEEEREMMSEFLGSNMKYEDFLQKVADYVRSKR